MGEESKEMPEGKTDEVLMTEYRLGDDSAFAILYERHSTKVFGFLRAKTSSDVLARDIFQTTFLKLHSTRGRYQPGLPFLPWIFAICRNELIDTMRKKSRNLEDATESQTVSLAELPEAQRKAVELRYQDDLAFEAIATKLNTSSENARQLVSRGVKALRRIYEKE
jgi:RNA polymerase sigma-70 factor (ECF subfamily)